MDNETLFTAIGLKPNVVKSTCASKKVSANLRTVLDKLGITECAPAKGNLFYKVATCVPSSIEHSRMFLAGYVNRGEIKKGSSFNLAVQYLMIDSTNTDYDKEAFEKACGVGIETTDEEISATILGMFEERKAELDELRYAVNVSKNTQYLLIP